MERRTFLSGLAAAGSALGQNATPRRPPNVLYIHSHDTGRYIQPYGYAVPTPNLQKLAEQGVLFRQAFDAAPTCSPSRACLLTGQCAHNNGMLGLAHRGFALNDYRQHIIHTLGANGYQSALAGVQHVAAKAQVTGYSEILATKSNRAEHVAPAAVRFLNSAPKQPFFLDVGFFETHREFHAPGPAEDPRYTMPPTPIPDTPRSRVDMAGFKASARVLDEAIGQVLQALESSGLAENTLVVCTTDHGVAFPNMKCNLFDQGMGVMLMMRGPGGFTGGKVSESLVSQLDIFPTLCEITETPKPSWLQGRSLLPLVRGNAEQINEEIFAEVNYHASYEPKRAVRTKRWKFIRHYGDKHTPVLPNCDDGPSKSVWLENGWRERLIDQEQLYDLLFDPNETRNLIEDKHYLATAKAMGGRLDRWMTATQDPLLKGPVKAPAGAKVNDPEGTSPKEPVQPASA
jgi:arylsulfatase A-like enzyme